MEELSLFSLTSPSSAAFLLPPGRDSIKSRFWVLIVFVFFNVLETPWGINWVTKAQRLEKLSEKTGETNND